MKCECCNSTTKAIGLLDSMSHDLETAVSGVGQLCGGFRKVNAEFKNKMGINPCSYTEAFADSMKRAVAGVEIVLSALENITTGLCSIEARITDAKDSLKPDHRSLKVVPEK